MSRSILATPIPSVAQNRDTLMSFFGQVGPLEHILWPAPDKPHLVQITYQHESDAERCVALSSGRIEWSDGSTIRLARVAASPQPSLPHIASPRVSVPQPMSPPSIRVGNQSLLPLPEPSTVYPSETEEEFRGDSREDDDWSCAMFYFEQMDSPPQPRLRITPFIAHQLLRADGYPLKILILDSARVQEETLTRALVQFSSPEVYQQAMVRFGTSSGICMRLMEHGHAAAVIRVTANRAKEKKVFAHRNNATTLCVTPAGMPLLGQEFRRQCYSHSVVFRPPEVGSRNQTL